MGAPLHRCWAGSQPCVLTVHAVVLWSRFNNPIAVIDSWYTRTLSFMYIQVRGMHAARLTYTHTLARKAHTPIVIRCV